MKLIPNPCVSICKIVSGVCVGCNRTQEEIKNWHKLPNEQKKNIISKINQMNSKN